MWGGGYKDVGGERGSVRDKKEVRDGVRGRGGERRSGAWEERENAGAAEEPGRPRGRARGWRGEGAEGRGGCQGKAEWQS